MLNNDAMYDGRQTVYNKKMLYFATFTHIANSTARQTQKATWPFVDFFVLFFSKLIYPFCLSIFQRIYLLLQWLGVQSALFPWLITPRFTHPCHTTLCSPWNPSEASALKEWTGMMLFFIQQHQQVGYYYQELRPTYITSPICNGSLRPEAWAGWNP